MDTYEHVRKLQRELWWRDVKYAVKVSLCCVGFGFIALLAFVVF